MDVAKSCKVKPGRRMVLKDHDPADTLGLQGKSEVDADMHADRDRLADLQLRLHVEGKRSVLICLQGSDASGKDGVVARLFGAFNPMGCKAVGFKEPSPQEKAHDFLWRYHAAAPAQGEIRVFNRTHYESVLVERVRGLVPKAIWAERYALLENFERALAENGTTVIKFFLHISADEQLERFKARLDDPVKRWKISEADYIERKLWPAYAKAYSDMLRETSSKQAPWYIIPANNKWFRDFAVSRILADRLEAMQLPMPAPQVDLDEIRRNYHAAERDAGHNAKADS